MADERTLKRIAKAQEKTADALQRIAVAVERYAERDPLKMMEDALLDDVAVGAPENVADILDDLPDAEAWRFD